MSVQDKKFISQSHTLMLLYNELIAKGLKNKEISQALGIYPSAFSNFINRVIKKILELDDQTSGINQSISQIFDQVNNISELKTRQRIGTYIEKLEALNHAPQEKLTSSQLFHTEKHMVNSSPEILKMLEGIYECYYVSTFGYRIKKEPFLISYTAEEDVFLVRKGNQIGPSSYEGMGYLTNSHLFTIQIREKNTLVKDSFLAHFQLPPFYSSAMNLLRGISISMSNSFLPISRKIILLKLSNVVDLASYNSMETCFYEKGGEENHEVINYFRNQHGFLEFVPIPQPTYTPKDLDQELKISNLYTS